MYMYMYVYLLCRLPEEGRGDQNVALHAFLRAECVYSNTVGHKKESTRVFPGNEVLKQPFKDCWLVWPYHIHVHVLYKRKVAHTYM